MVQGRGPATFAVTLATFVIATVFVAARFVTRGWLVKSIKQDDWWMLAAWIVSLGFSAAICIGTRFGLGMHVSDIPPDHLNPLRQTSFAYSVLYNPCLMLTKTSIIVFYLSVMSKDVDPVFKWCNWITLAVVNVTGTALTFLNIFQCSPVSAGYTFPTPPSARCEDIVTLYLSSAPVNIITDVAILFLPMPILTGMRLPKKQKIILIVTFSAGAFVAIVDVIRVAYLQNAALDRLTNIGTGGNGNQIKDQSDIPWYTSLSFMWSAIEVNIGIICACVPSLKPLFLRFLPSFIRDTNEISPDNSLDVEVENINAEKLDGGDPLTMITNPAAFRKPAVREYDGDDDGDNMGFLNMLSGPDEDAPGSPLSRTSTRMSRISRTSTVQSSASDFGFVKMDKSRNMLKLNNRKSVWPVAVVTIVFFLWGFAYGLLDTLNGKFQVVAKLTSDQSLGLHAAYYCGYLIGPLTLGRFVLIRYGFKATMIAGLAVYGCGTLVFWPSAVLTSYPAFIVSNFVVAFGLSCLEIAANPYIALCGPLEYAEVRLNLSQAVQAVGTIFSPLLAQRVFFHSVTTSLSNNASSLLSVQWAYLGISLAVWLLAVGFYYIPLPEATDDQLEEQAEKRSAIYRTRIGPLRVVWVTLGIGVMSQWCYVGGQEGIGGHAQDLIKFVKPNSSLDPSSWQTVGHTTFALGRFLGAFLNYLVKPRWILLGMYVGAIILTGLQMKIVGDGGLAVILLLYFFEGSIFPIIFAASMRGMGNQTKTAAAFMTAAISGGTVVPVIQWAVQKSTNLQYGYSVVVGVFCFGALFPIYLCLHPAAKAQVDPIHETRDRRRARRRQLRRESKMSTTSNTSVSNKFGLAGIIARRRKQKSEDELTQQRNSVDVPETPINEKIESWNVFSVPDAVHLREPSGHVAELSNWPTADSKVSEQSASSNGGSSQKSGSNQSDAITPQRREWTDDDDIRDDYHQALKGL